MEPQPALVAIVGQDVQRRLARIGITTCRDLAATTIQRLVRQGRVFPGQAALWQSAARLVVGVGVPPAIARALVDVGVDGPRDLAGRDARSLHQLLAGRQDLPPVEEKDVAILIHAARHAL